MNPRLDHHRSDMSRSWWAVACAGLILLITTSCASGKSSASSTTSTTIKNLPSPSTSTPIVSTTTTPPPEPLRVSVTTSPDHVFPGTVVTFSVEIRSPGTLDSENVQFGDGGTSGANAGTIKCGATARADHTSSYTHAYTKPGTYGFSDEVEVIGPPAACMRKGTQGTATVIVASPTQNASGGIVQSPTGNIVCGLSYGSTTDNQRVHCATFTPPQTADMAADGAVTKCSGSQCSLGNPGSNVPTLAYGSATGVGPFECISSASGMTCTVTGGRGSPFLGPE